MIGDDDEPYFPPPEGPRVHVFLGWPAPPPPELVARLSRC
jgi:hypothetical protein